MTRERLDVIHHREHGVHRESLGSITVGGGSVAKVPEKGLRGRRVVDHG